MPSSAPRRRTPLPLVVPLLALVGLAVMGFYAVPAVVEHRRLERAYTKRSRMAREAQTKLDRRRRVLNRSTETGDTYSRRKKRHVLLNQGPRYIELRDARVAAESAARRPASSGSRRP